MKILTSGILTVLFLVLGMVYHDFQINRVFEISFFGTAASCFLVFEWFLHHGPASVWS